MHAAHIIKQKQKQKSINANESENKNKTLKTLEYMKRSGNMRLKNNINVFGLLFQLVITNLAAVALLGLLRGFLFYIC